MPSKCSISENESHRSLGVAIKIAGDNSLKNALKILIGRFEKSDSRRLMFLRAVSKYSLPEISVKRNLTEGASGRYYFGKNKVEISFYGTLFNGVACCNNPKESVAHTLAHEFRHWMQDALPHVFGWRRKVGFLFYDWMVFLKNLSAEIKNLFNLALPYYCLALPVFVALGFLVDIFFSHDFSRFVMLFLVVPTAVLIFSHVIALFLSVRLYRLLYKINPLETDARKFAAFAVEQKEWIGVVRIDTIKIRNTPPW